MCVNVTQIGVNSAFCCGLFSAADIFLETGRVCGIKTKINCSMCVFTVMKNMSPSATVRLIDVCLIVDNNGALGHRGRRYISLWIHTQYLFA